jgi:hypothetical protein
MCGTLLFAEQFAFLGKNVLTWANLGPVTFPELTRIPAWAIFVGLTAGAVMLFRQIEGWERRS